MKAIGAPISTFSSLSELANTSIATRGAFPLPTVSQGRQYGKEFLARSEVLHLGSIVGNLCTQLLIHGPCDPYRPQLSPAETESQEFLPTLEDSDFWSVPSHERDEIYKAVGAVFWHLVILSQAFGLDLRTCIMKKVELNCRKYPVSLCKGKSGKYTAYSTETGITETNQSTLDIHVETPDDEKKEELKNIYPTTVSDTQLLIRKFATDRKWSRYHTPRNILLAMMGEVGEMAELFQWRGDGDPIEQNDKGLRGSGWKEEDIDHAGQELADVAIYCLRLADVIGMHDLGNAAIQYAQNSNLEEAN